MKTENQNNQTASASQKSAAAVLEIIQAIAAAIRELREVPAGHLYAQLMGNMTLDQFNQIITILVGADLITRSGSHLLTWKGPQS